MKISHQIGLGLGTAVLSFLLAGFFGSSSREDVIFSSPSDNRYQHEQQQVAVVKIDDGYGSGVVFKRDSKDGERVFLWTARHVLEDRGTNKIEVLRVVRWGSSKLTMSFAAKVIYTSSNDVALLWVDCPPSAFRGSQFSTGPLNIGDRVFAVGTPSQMEGSITEGRISGIGRRLYIWPEVDQTDATFSPGISGGAVFDSNGLVVGIAVGRLMETAVNFFVPLHAMQSEQTKWALWGSECPEDKVLNFLAALYDVKAP